MSWRMKLGRNWGRLGMKFKLKDVCTRLSSGKGISSKFISESGNFPVYGGNGLRGYTEKSNFIGECAIIGRQGAFCGNVRYFFGEAYMTEHAVVVCANENHDTRYLSYLLASMQLGRLSGQSAQPGLSVKVLAEQEVDMPPLAQQKKVTSILASIENKIELNNKINKNLSDLLQAIYQKQFGEVSMGANQGILSDICSYSKEKVAVSELNVNTYFSTENMLPEKAGSTKATSLPTTPQTTACRNGDTLISNIRPYFKKIVYCEDMCGCSTDVLCFTPVQSQYAAYLFSTLYTDKFFAFMVAGSKGTKMPRGDKQQIMTYPVVLPAESQLEEFNAIAFPILEQLNSNKAENKRLSALRDALLPKLMSGGIDISAIDL